jgi:hypothetical protein
MACTGTPPFLTTLALSLLALLSSPLLFSSPSSFLSLSLHIPREKEIRILFARLFGLAPGVAVVLLGLAKETQTHQKVPKKIQMRAEFREKRERVTKM